MGKHLDGTSSYSSTGGGEETTPVTTACREVNDQMVTCVKVGVMYIYTLHKTEGMFIPGGKRDDACDH